MPASDPYGYAPRQGAIADPDYLTRRAAFDPSTVNVNSATAPPGIPQFVWDRWGQSQRQQWLSTQGWAAGQLQEQQQFLPEGVTLEQFDAYKERGIVPPGVNPAVMQQAAQAYGEFKRPSGSGLIPSIMKPVGRVAENVIAPIGEFAKENPALLFGAPLAIAAAGGYFGGAGAAGGGGAAGAEGASLTPGSALPTTTAELLAGSGVAPGAAGNLLGATTTFPGSAITGAGLNVGAPVAGIGASAGAGGAASSMTGGAAPGLPAGAQTLTGGAAGTTGAAGGGSVLDQLRELLGSDDPTLAENIIDTVGSLFGASQASRAAGRAVDAQVESAREALDFLRETRDISLAQQQPFIEASQGALAKMLRLGGQEIPAALRAALETQGIDPSSITADWQTDPGYEFRTSEAQRMFENSAFAKGSGMNPRVNQSFLQNIQDYASNEYSNVYNRIAGIAGFRDVLPVSAQTSAQYGAGAANIAMNRGEVRGTGYIAQSNAVQNAIDQLSKINWAFGRNR